MINEERKERYYQYKLSTSVTNTFPIETNIKRAAHYENVYKKDLCDFNANEITEMYKLMAFSSVSSLIVMNNTLKNYTDWCIQENFVRINQNIYDTISSDVLSTLVNKALVEYKILTREELFVLLNKMENARDKFIILSFFEYGISKSNFEDTVKARLSDIDEVNHKIKLYSGRTVDISDELIQYAKESVATEAKRLPYEKVKWVDDGTIIKRSSKTTDKPRNLGRTIYNNYVKIMNMLDCPYIRANDIASSGTVHMVNQLAKLHNCKSIDILNNKSFRAQVEHQYNIRHISPTAFMQKYGDYLI